MSPLTRSPLTIELALLGFLHAGPLHGYQIHKQLSDPAGLGLVWHLKQAHLYALLTRLEQAGYVIVRREPQEQRPPRKVFRLTASGRDAYRHWVQAPVPNGRDLRLAFMTKYFFARQEDAAVQARLLQRQRRACRDWLRAQQAQADAVGRTQAFEYQVCQFRMGQIEAMLAWLDQLVPTNDG